MKTNAIRRPHPLDDLFMFEAVKSGANYSAFISN
jgi:hypothetical protein